MKITWGALATDGAGKLGGHAAQHGKAGAILRTITQPKKSATRGQSKRRLNVQMLSQSWRLLSEPQRLTWINAAPLGSSGFDFYMEINMQLLNINLPLLESYILPVQNPLTTIAPYYNLIYNDAGPDSYMSLTKWSGNNATPVSPWVPSFLWSGWIGPGQYFYPKMDKVLNVDLNDYSSFYYNVFWEGIAPSNAKALGIGFKCKYQERWINEDTGQVFLGDIVAVNWGETIEIGRSFAPGHFLLSRVLTEDAGQYTLFTDWGSDRTAPGAEDWEPYFWSTGWMDSVPFPIPTYSYHIPLSAITLPDNTSFTITFGHEPGNAIPPATEGQIISVGFNWRNTITGELSNNDQGTFEAINS